MNHIVLVGDSIFDNRAYTRGGPEVVDQVRELLPRGWRASLLALDGATTDRARLQAGRIPLDASHLVLSVGGNDALWKAGVIQAPADSVSDALAQLDDLAREFEDKYRSTVAEFLRLKLPLTLCSIYNGCFPDPKYQRLVSIALMVFNDVILRVGIEHSLSMIDLRLICCSPKDYANPIEPSSAGGAKIARTIVNLITRDPVMNRCARVVI
jgi:GDSL-like Lipase/Acylhydrolase family